VKITIRRIKELTGKGVSLDVYVNGEIKGSIKPTGTLELQLEEQEVEIYLKTSWCESNRMQLRSDAELKVHARGGLLGATLLSLYKPNLTYLLTKDE
jgi:hypothetical protein